jgi:hypothetical protein
MPKLERKWYAQFVTPPGEVEAWSVLGIDNDDLKKELSPQTETKKNVLGETAFNHNGFEVEVSVEPYYADKGSSLYTALSKIALEESYGSTDCIGKYAEVIFDANTAGTSVFTGVAYIQDAWIIPQSIGGDTSGVQIPFKLNPVGPKIKKNISYDASTHTPTFTPIA